MAVTKLKRPDSRRDRIPFDIHSHERFWIHCYDWLHTRGYTLRPRYKPGWRPSWTTRSQALKCEEHAYYPSSSSSIMDATRAADGSEVTLKRISKHLHPFEIEIGLFFSSYELKDVPANHCAPFHDVLQVPDEEDLAIIVMPFLTKFDHPSFETVGEVVDCLRQIFEGVQFMHQHRVAHRDLMSLNIMMNALHLFPEGHHPVYTMRTPDLQRDAPIISRSRSPPRYFLIDFGLSRRYGEDCYDGPWPPQEVVIRGGDKSAPEHKTHTACDPFPTDVYYLGHMIQEEFFQSNPPKEHLSFLAHLAADMTREDPAKRPTIDEVVERFHQLWRGLDSRVLKERVEPSRSVRQKLRKMFSSHDGAS